MDWFHQLSFMVASVFIPLALLSFFCMRSGRKLLLPPGPQPLPIIGNMLMMDQLTHRGLARLAERYGGLFHLRLGSLHAVVVSTPEMARLVLQVQDASFCNRPVTAAIAYLTYDRADMAFANYGPFWRQTRKLCVMKLFSRRRLQSWASVRQEVDSAVRFAARRSGSSVDVGDLAFTLAKNVTFMAAFGAQSHGNQGEFAGILQEYSKLFGEFNISDFLPWLRWMDLQGIDKRLKVARQAIDRYIDVIIDDHLANPKEADAQDADMVDGMLAFLGDSGDTNEGGDLHGDLSLTRSNIKAIIMDVMFGGTETVALGIEWAMAELLKSPEELKRTQQELASVVGLHRKVDDSDLDKLPYLKCAVKEMLRLHPPLPLLQHQATQDCELAGYFIPVGTRVFVNAWGIGRDRDAWKSPNAFRPSRFALGGDAAAFDFRGSCFELLPFGSGRRSCPGMQLGLYVLELAVAQLLHCFDWSLPAGTKPGDLDMGDVFGLTAPKAVRLMAVPTPRLTCPLL
ncbi:unnamed protein product [Musa acuminata subsp. malaccensis]|uniref:(wild Malaysian banana) hypothetical protein n=1 Tax=Musa acuminata subsp. malaccensis TaxID=214687 RepID=A0A804IRQ0_MUSAM|nr:PREDICTED: cytochrome P450 84A1-like [Musa acuminata subsp. malaccensis]CAG1842803.1 unnamed protein product [Musa acuminata subsp. malaccensis]